jgi:hypothetical protein
MDNKRFYRLAAALWVDCWLRRSERALGPASKSLPSDLGITREHFFHAHNNQRTKSSASIVHGCPVVTSSNLPIDESRNMDLEEDFYPTFHRYSACALLKFVGKQREKVVR